MTTERDPQTRTVLSWLRDDAHENAERVLLRALDEVDTTRQRRSWWPAWRSPTMNTSAKVAVVTAAVLVVALVGYQQLPTTALPGTPTTAPSLATPLPTSGPVPSPTEFAVATSMPAQANLPPGRYSVGVPGSDVQVEFTVGAGWTSGGGGVSTPDWYVTSANGAISFFTVSRVPADACEWVFESRIGTGVDDLVAALENQVNSVTTAPVDVTVGGYEGKRLDIGPEASAPCEDLLWWFQGDGEPGRGAEAGQAIRDTVYALDVDGQRIVIVIYPIGPDGAFDEILDSVRLIRT